MASASKLIVDDLDLIPGDLHWGRRRTNCASRPGVKGAEHVFRVDLSARKVVPVTSGERGVRGFDINEKAGVMTYLANDFEHLDDLYASALDGSGERQLTHLNAKLWSELDARQGGADALQEHRRLGHRWLPGEAGRLAAGQEIPDGS